MTRPKSQRVVIRKSDAALLKLLGERPVVDRGASGGVVWVWTNEVRHAT